MSGEEPAGQLTDHIQAAGKAIPKTRFSKKNFPWFHGSMRDARKLLKKEGKLSDFFSFSFF